MKSHVHPIALVTGGSSGIGQATAIALAKSGCKVYELSRHGHSQAPIHHITADVTDEKTVMMAINRLINLEGKIDIVINCAGYGISGAIEFTDLTDAKSQFNVNFFGMVNVNKYVLHHMRENRKGRIVNISSVAAVAHIPFQAYYSASKAAVNSYTCALANEVRPYGITVTAVQPGDICTGFTTARQKSYLGDSIYHGRISRSVSQMEKDEQNGMTARHAGNYIAKIALKGKVKPIYSIGIMYQFFCLVIKLAPCNFVNTIIGKIYAK